MLAYATAELVERLMTLTPPQRAAIDRIVDHVYIRNQPLAHLLRGDDKIVSERRYYDKGEINPVTGDWKRRPGWHHDPRFQEALTEAVRLALQARTREEVHAWAEAKRRARMATPDVIQEVIAIATGYELQRDGRGRSVIDQATGQPAIARRGSEDKDRVAASKILLDYARLDVSVAGDGERADEEHDWWRASDDGNETD